MKDFIRRFKAIFLTFLLISPFLRAVDIDQKSDNVKIVAHRGGNVERPENTISAFKRAVELGSDIIEIDLRTSKDGHLFILHDAKLDRTTNGSGPATDLTLNELRQLDAGSWFDSDYSNERIPSFRGVLKWATEEDVVLLLDLKESGREYAENVARNVQDYGIEKNMVIGVRSPDQARVFRELLPASRQLAFMSSPDDIEAYAEAGVDVIRLWLHWLEKGPELADRVREAGKKLMINGTDGNINETKTIMGFSPDWILIDNPARLIESIKKLR